MRTAMPPFSDRDADAIIALPAAVDEGVPQQLPVALAFAFSKNHSSAWPACPVPELLQDAARRAVEAGADTIVCKLIGDEKKKKKAGRGEEAESKAAASSYECKGKHAMPEFKTPSAHYECDGCGKKNLPKVRNEGREKIRTRKDS